MKCLILIALAAASHAQSFPQDTPEVAAAKAAHFAEHAKFNAYAGVPPPEQYRSANFDRSPNSFPQAPVANPQSFFPETPGFATPNAAQFTDPGRANAFVGAPHPDQFRSNNFDHSSNTFPQAPAANPQRFFAENPGFATPNAAQFADPAKANEFVGGPHPDQYRSFGFNQSPATFSAPAVPPQGFTAERGVAPLAPAAPATPAGPRSADPYAEYYRSYYNYYLPILSRASQSRSPSSSPTVLPDGYLAETPEVAHARITHLYNLYKEASRP